MSAPTSVARLGSSLRTIRSRRVQVLPSQMRREEARSLSSSTTRSALSLPWEEYLRIRKGKRRWEIATTIPSTVVGLGSGLAYFGSLTSDGTSLILGVDPMWVYAAATISCAGAGYLVGPIIGSTFWRLTHRQKVALIDAREKEFHNHIVKNRVDPTRQSATNPVPDYYGENIGSMKDYRQWLRDQARFRKKSEWPEDV